MPANFIVDEEFFNKVVRHRKTMHNVPEHEYLLRSVYICVIHWETWLEHGWCLWGVRLIISFMKPNLHCSEMICGMHEFASPYQIYCGHVRKSDIFLPYIENTFFKESHNAVLRWMNDCFNYWTETPVFIGTCVLSSCHC